MTKSPRTGFCLGLLTCSQLGGLTGDDAMLAGALDDLGILVKPVVWSELPSVECDAVVIRSTWDYHLHCDEFMRALRAAEKSGITVWNSPDVVAWNAHKGYLRDLQSAGIPIVPSHWVDKGTNLNLRGIIAQTGWSDVVVKPAVSAGAYRTFRVSLPVEAPDEASFSDAVEVGDVIIQPYLREIGDGELSLIFVEGNFTHAVRKRPAPGDFRVQAQFGGTTEAVVPDAGVVASARAFLRVLSETPLYARVDGCMVDGAFVLMELELIEPDLFFGTSDSGCRRLASALCGRLTQMAFDRQGTPV